MTVGELIEMLKTVDSNMEVVSAIPETAYDIDSYPENIKIGSIEEYDFEVDGYHRALVFKVAGYNPDLWDWVNNYPHGIPWKEQEDDE